MSTLLRASILISCVAVAAVTPACQTPPVTPAASSGEAMPQDVRSRIKEARFQAAIKGLDFEGNLVVVVEPLGGDRDLARQHQAAGLEALQGNRLTGAITELAQAVRTAPQDAALHNSLGVALLAKGKSRYAATAFRTAVSLDPGLVEAQYNLADTLWRLGRATEAIEQMLTVLKLDPRHAVAHERLAIWHYYAGDGAAAWEHVRFARELGRQPPPQFLTLLESRMPQPGRK